MSSNLQKRQKVFRGKIVHFKFLTIKQIKKQFKCLQLTIEPSI